METVINNYLVDIDGTICEDIPNEESHRFGNAKVIDGAIEKINKLYDTGHSVVFFTARTDEHKEVTENWLKECGFKYNYVIYNKSRGGNYVWIDNHKITAYRFENNWETIIEKNDE